jgi:hypothetical protein
LVAGALFEVVVASTVNALCDVVGLFVVTNQDGATLVVDAVIGVVVTDTLERFAGDVDVINVGLRRDFTCEHHQTGVTKRFSGNAAIRVLCQDGVQDGVGDLVGDLIGMAFRNGFRSKEIRVGHATFLYFLCQWNERHRTKIEMRLTL